MSNWFDWQGFTWRLKGRMIKDLVDTRGLIFYTEALFSSMQRDSTAAVLPKERRNTSAFLLSWLLLWDDKYLRYGFIMLCWELSLRSDWIHIIVRYSRGELNCHAWWPLSLCRLQNRLLVSTVLHPSSVMIEDILKEVVEPLTIEHTLISCLSLYVAIMALSFL
jgi:hypothetical protein